MADQSSVQSLLQQLAGTASAGQANLPSAVNNGNPNTIYNQPLKAGGYLPPVTNGLDQWRINPASNGNNAPINWQQLAANAPGNNLSSILPKWPTQVPVVNVPGWGGVPTPSTGGGGTPNTGGNLPPSGGGHGPLGNGGHALAPGEGFGGIYGNTNHGIGLPDLGSAFSNAPAPGMVPTTNASDPAGWGGLDSSSIQGILGTNLNLGSAGQSLANSWLGQQLGIKPDGSLSLGQMLDYVIPGNVYMAQTGKLNLLNLIPGLLSKINPALGAAAKAAMTWLAKHTHIQVLQRWLQRNQDNASGGGGGGGSGALGGLGGGVVGGPGAFGGFGGTPSVYIGGPGGSIGGAPGVDPNVIIPITDENNQ